MGNVIQLPNKTQKQLLAEAARTIRQNNLQINFLCKSVDYLRNQIRDLSFEITDSSEVRRLKIRKIFIKSEMIKIYGTEDERELSIGSVINIGKDDWLLWIPTENLNL